MVFHWYGFIIGVAVISALTLAERTAKRAHIPDSVFSHLSWSVISAGFIGARAWHIVTDFAVYRTAPLSAVFAVWNGGMSIIGALLAGAATLGFLYWKKPEYRQYIPKYLDALTVPLAIGQIIGRVANAVNYELYGLPTSLPWAIYIPPAFRLESVQSSEYFHPLFAYEMVGVALIIAVPQNRQALLRYLLAYAVLRFFLDFFRIERGVVYATMGVNQIVLLLVISVLCIIWYYMRTRYKTHEKVSHHTAH